jgi:hypothetical protein
MKHENGYQERRRYPRINKNMPLELKSGDSVVIAESINLSCIGAYCKVNKHIPLMTKLKIVFELLYDSEGNGGDHVECHGVVVRIDEVLSENSKVFGGYNVAIYFHDIEESEKNKIKNFVEKYRHAKKTSELASA